MGTFHIEENWYLIPDELSWNLAKKVKEGTKQKAEYYGTTYHASPAAALLFYIEKRRREAAGNAGDGDLRDLLNILSSENKRLSDALSPVLELVTSINELERT